MRAVATNFHTGFITYAIVLSASVSKTAIVYLMPTTTHTAGFYKLIAVTARTSMDIQCFGPQRVAFTHRWHCVPYYSKCVIHYTTAMVRMYLLL